MKMENKTITLNNGVKIPIIGFGTWLIDEGICEEVVLNALKVGFRHIDTAEAYGNEEAVGRAIKASGLKREEIFLTTKVLAEAKTYDEAIKQIEKSFKRLDIDYIDLFIIHSPTPWSEFKSGKHYKKENLEVWKALTKYYNEGKIKAIGVSNFEIEDLENILNNSSILPQVNQILTHITNTPFELIDFCHKNNIQVEAYSPIAHGEILNNENLIKMAKKYNVSVAQLCIRYTLQLGLISLPKAKSLKHIKENFDVDFVISESDMKELISLDHINNYGKYSYFPVFKNFK